MSCRPARPAAKDPFGHDSDSDSDSDSDVGDDLMDDGGDSGDSSDVSLPSGLVPHPSAEHKCGITQGVFDVRSPAGGAKDRAKGRWRRGGMTGCVGGTGGLVAAGASPKYIHTATPQLPHAVLLRLPTNLVHCRAHVLPPLSLHISPTIRFPLLWSLPPLTLYPQKHFRPKLPEDSKKKGKARKTKVEWTVRETRDLLDGVKKHGKGSWTKIIDDNEYSFHRGRITNDLSNVGC